MDFLRTARSLLIAVALAAAGGAFAQFGTSPVLEIFPATPTAGEEFVVRTTTSGFIQLATSSVVSGTRVDLSTRVFVPDFGLQPPSFPVSAVTQVASPGSYTVFWTLSRTFDEQTYTDTSPIALGTIVVAPVIAKAAPQSTTLSGLYSTPALSGSGLTIEQGVSGQLFAVTYTQNAATAPQPIWYVMPSGQWLSPTRFRGVLYATSGTPASLPYVASRLTTSPAGVITLDFATTASGDTVTVQVEGLTLPIAGTLSKYRF